MPTILPQTQALVSKLIDLMPTRYQLNSLQALLGLFLEATGSPLTEYCVRFHHAKPTKPKGTHFI